MKKAHILLSALFLFPFFAAFSQKDTTEVTLGKKKLLIIEEKAKKEREIENLEKGKETFEKEIERAREEQEKLREMNEELREKNASANADSALQSVKTEIAENEKKIAENQKKIEAFDKGIEEIEKGIEQMRNDLDEFEKEKRHIHLGNNDDCDDSFDAHWSGFQLGFNNFLTEDYALASDQQAGILKLNPEKSISFSLNLFEYNYALGNSKHAGFATGLGLDWNSFAIAENTDLAVVDGVLTSIPVDSDVRKYTKNKFNMTYLTAPLLFEYQIPAGKRNFFVNFGGTASVRLWSKQKQEFDEDGNDRVNRTKDDFELSPFRLGATAKIGYGPISLYANYSFTPLLKTNHGPELYPFTVGLTIINF